MYSNASRLVSKVGFFTKKIIFLTFRDTYLRNAQKIFMGSSEFSNLRAPNNDPVLCKHLTHQMCKHLTHQKVDQVKAVSGNIILADVYHSTKKITKLIENYNLDEALDVFDKMPEKDTVVWNLMLKGYLRFGDLEMGLKLFDEMPEKNVISWTTLVNGLLRYGRVEEAERFFWGMPVRDVTAWNVMINGYFDNGRVEKAIELFTMIPGKDVILWTSMISLLDRHRGCDEARLLFLEMMRSGVVPNSCSLSSVITACPKESDLFFGLQIHGHIIKLGALSDAYVSASLISFYANFKLMKDSCKVFSERLHMNVVVWTSLMTGYGSNNEHEEALSVLVAMFRNGIYPNQSSFTSALHSSSELEVIDLAKQIHGASIKLGLGTDDFVGNSLVVLYNKFGNISSGIDVFNEITCKNIVSWNSLVVGCSQHGYGKAALALFCQMVRAGIEPDDITFTGLLSACSHSGMLQKGRRIFKCLQQSKSKEVKLEHYSCMLDILCRCGELEEAEMLIRNMPMRANLSMWLSLLNGCRRHHNFVIAERVTHDILNIDPQCSSAHILLSNMYAFAGRWNDVARVRKQMKKSGTVKTPGISWG